MRIITNEGEEATAQWLRNIIAEALDTLAVIKRTGNQVVDDDILAAEQALRRALWTARDAKE